MNDNDLKMKLREPLRRITSPPFAMEDVARRARGLRVRRVFASGLAVAVVAAGIAVPLWALSSVGGDHRVLPGAAQAIDRFGITIALPEGWEGRVTQQLGDTRYLEAASFPVDLDLDKFLSDSRSSMGPDGATIYMTELTSTCPCPGFEHIDLPFSMSSADFEAGGFEGVPTDHAFGRRTFIANGRWFDLWIEFGSAPPPSHRLEDVNAALATLRVAADSGWTTHADQDDAVSISTPDGWSFREDPVPNVAEPRIIFATGSWDFEGGGECGPDPALSDLPEDGAFVWLLEYRDISQIHLSDFPPRPLPFRLGGEPATYECSASRPTYLIRFVDGWRYFQFHVALGDQATPETRQDALDSLDSFTVGLLPEAETARLWIALCERVTWLLCPFSDWVRNSIWEAGFSVEGETATAIVGKEHDTEFHMWTTAESLDRLASEGYRRLTIVDGTTVYTDGTRDVWEIRGIAVWVQEGPKTSALPNERAIEALVRATQRTRFGAG